MNVFETAIQTTSSVLVSRFPGYSFAFASGSIIRGEGTKGSDIDVVVVFDRLETAWRETFIEGDLPFEVFVHDPETLSWFFESDIARGYPVIIHMVATGHVLGPNADKGQVWKDHAASVIRAGPPELVGEKLNALKYQITDLLDDLHGDRGGPERRAIAAQLYQSLADLMLLGRGTWSGRGKWIPRLLREMDQELANRFDDAFRQVSLGNVEELCNLTHAELERHGGPFFAGDKRVASQKARRMTFVDLG
ncbi:nucleotidyltransferase domain-containing protein [Agrobacterium rhizogenes]|nr:nucleotidyltransferase domain-containing protein [Rhizobium rhizogenes]NTI94362.1 nucleotidyltransferase domain-containing protein [Rhizobium rhizogenes]NTJ56829.1 nucleotidyltransferase domain-containing protein [Rhizobium rhizogenes]OCJ14990.1 nucleotidyltransferase [Agrobacterium sp. B133/95]